jgi:hypothetical protein
VRYGQTYRVEFEIKNRTMDNVQNVVLRYIMLGTPLSDIREGKENNKDSWYVVQ